MKIVRLFMSVILLGAISIGCHMVKEIPLEKTVTYPDIVELYYDMYGAHGKFESLPGEPFKLSLMIHKDHVLKAEQFIWNTHLYCGAIGGSIEQNQQTLTCYSKTNPNRILFASRCTIIPTTPLGYGGSTSVSAKMTIVVEKNNRPDKEQLDNQALASSQIDKAKEELKELRKKLDKEKEEKEKKKNN